MKRTLAVIVAVLLGLAAQATRPEAAAACSYPSDTIGVHDTPANGLVVIDVLCVFGGCFEGELPTELPVLDVTAGEIVPGEIARVAGSMDDNAIIAWRPDAPLVPGHIYEVLWQPEAVQSFADIDFQFTALEPATWTPQDIPVAASIWLQEQASETVTCEAVNNILCGPETSTYSMEIGLDASKLVGLQASIDSSTVPMVAYGQYVVTMALWGDGEEQPEQSEVTGFLYSSISSSAVFKTARDSYCYHVEVTSLIDDSVAVTEDCIAHDLGELTTTPFTDQMIAAQLGRCVSAPEGYVDLWCGPRRAHCSVMAAGGTIEMGCDTVEGVCPEVEPNDPKGPSGPDEPLSPNVDPNVDPNDDDDADEVMPEHGSGCSATHADGGGAPWPSIMFTGALWLLMVGRKRRASTRRSL